MRERTVWIVMGLLVIAFASLIGLGSGGLMLLVVVPLLTLGMAGIGRLLARPVDSAWLPNLIVVAFVAKMIGAAVRFHYVTRVYASGDAFGYHRGGIEYALQWRAGDPPGLSGGGGFGTQVMEWVAGLVFVPFMPDFLGAFLLFAALSFFGQLALYAAFRRWAQPHQLKIFALLILFLPSYVFWPSSVGKEAVMLLGLGLTTYFIVRSFEAYEFRWLAGTGILLIGISFIRIHIAALVVGALLVTALITKPRVRVPGAGTRRLLVIVVIAGGLLMVADSFQARYGADPFNLAEVETFTDTVVDRTSRGSVVAGGPVSSPADIPDALALVLFRPFIWEARTAEHVLSALETTWLLVLFVWKLPAIFRNRKQWRANALVVFSSAYIFGFAIAFSAIRNLGIIARQRTQVLAFFIIVIVALGWEAPISRKRRSLSEDPRVADTRQERRLVPVGSGSPPSPE